MKIRDINKTGSGPWIALSGCNDGVLYRRGISLTIDDGSGREVDVPDLTNNPSDTAEQEEDLMLLRWVLTQATLQGKIVDAESPEFIAWATEMIREYRNLMEKDKQGHSS